MFLSADDPAEEWRDELLARMPELDVRIWPEVGDPAEIEVALVWRPPPGELTRYPNLKAILSLGAGVDGLLADATLPDVPLARMVDASLTRGMTEYVVLAVLRHHRRFDQFARTAHDERVVRIRHDEQRFQATEHTVASPILCQLDDGTLKVAREPFELFLEAFEEREGIRRGAREPGEHLVVRKQSDLLGVGLHDRVAHGDLPVSAHGDAAVLSHAQDGGRVGTLLHDPPP